MKITTIGIDFAKEVFRFTGWICTVRLCYVNNYSVARWRGSLPIWILAWFAWKPAVVHTTGRIWLYCQTHVTPVRQTIMRRPTSMTMSDDFLRRL